MSKETAVLESEAKTEIIGKADVELAYQELASTSRVEVAHKVHADAVKRLHELDVKLRSAFEELVKAQNLMHEIGTEVVTKFSRPMDSAWAAWKNEKR